MPIQILLSWSGGKDSALALYEMQRSRECEIASLLTTITRDYDRISMHGVRRVLLEEQAQSLGYSLEQVFISNACVNEEYENTMRAVLTKYQAQGVSSVVFGDLFLEEIRKYREEKLAQVNMRALFPLWGKNTIELAHTFIDLGFKAILVCVDSQALDGKFVGRCFDKELLSELPSRVDPCGENGEFHTFVFDGPVFKKPVCFEEGEIVLRDKRFWYCDLLPQKSEIAEKS
jgi:uncharacterized protein (TIGR00290 family)